MNIPELWELVEEYAYTFKGVVKSLEKNTMLQHDATIYALDDRYIMRYTTYYQMSNGNVVEYNRICSVSTPEKIIELPFAKAVIEFNDFLVLGSDKLYFYKNYELVKTIQCSPVRCLAKNDKLISGHEDGTIRIGDTIIYTDEVVDHLAVNEDYVISAGHSICIWKNGCIGKFRFNYIYGLFPKQMVVLCDGSIAISSDGYVFIYNEKMKIFKHDHCAMAVSGKTLKLMAVDGTTTVLE